MAIKGLTDNVLPRFPQLGRLRKGGAKQIKNGKEIYGKDLTYFRFTSERPEIVKAFHDAYGEQPAALHIYLPYARLEDNFEAWRELWVKGGMRHRCDGETCVDWLGPDGKYHHEPIPCPGGCDEVGRLTVILPELIRAGYVGYVTLQTGSINDIQSITASLLAVAEARQDNPLGLRGIEFILRRHPGMVSTPGWGDDKASRQRVEKWLVSIEPTTTWVEMQLQIAARSVLVSGPGSLVATPSGLLDTSTGEVIQAPDDVEDGDFDAVPSEPPAPPTNGHADPPQDEPLQGANDLEDWWEQNIANQPSPAGPAVPPAPAPSPAPPATSAASGDSISDKQTALLEKLLRDIYPDGNRVKFTKWLERNYSVTDIKRLTKRQAIAVIDVLKQRTTAASSNAAASSAAGAAQPAASPTA